MTGNGHEVWVFAFTAFDWGDRTGGKRKKRKLSFWLFGLVVMKSFGATVARDAFR
jgi:hypothetical protein